MRDIQPPVNFKKLEIDGNDSIDIPRPHYKHAKRTNKRLVSFTIFTIAIVLIVGGLGGYLLLLKNNASLDNATASDDQHATTSQGVTAQSVVSDAKAAAKGMIKETLQESDGSSYNIFDAPPFKPIGYSFSVRPSADYGFGSYGTKETIATDLMLIQKTLVDNGLKETVLDPGSEVGQFAANYESAGIICILTDQKPSDPSPTNTNDNALLGCANKSDYLANAAMLRPYYIVFASQNQSDTSKLLISGPVLKPSRTPGYTLATIAISGSDYGAVGGFAGLFYITPDKTLHYFTGTQNELSCSKYSSTDLQKAYLGELCYNDETGSSQATVKLQQ